MLKVEEKEKVKDVLKELHLNPKLNFAYFLGEIDETNDKIKELESKMQLILHNQQIIDRKLDMIIKRIG